MDHEGASNSTLRMNEITHAFTHLKTTRPTDERLLAAAKDDNDDLLLEIFEDPDSFDINYQDGFVYCLQPDYRALSLIRNSKTWQYRCLDHIFQARVIPAEQKAAACDSCQPSTTREAVTHNTRCLPQELMTTLESSMNPPLC